MPKSKRARIVPTSKTGKNRKDQARRLYSNIQAAVAAHAHIWVFSVQNVRNSLLKQVRAQLAADCRIFMGKTKVMVHALGAGGVDGEVEAAPGLGLLTPFLSGEVGLLFTNWEPARIEEYFAGFRAWDYARAGTVAGEGFVIPSGSGGLTTTTSSSSSSSLDGAGGDPIPVAIEPTLRKLGVPTRIVRGRVVLEGSGDDLADTTASTGEDAAGYVVCRPGDILDSRQTTLLKIFGVRMAEFRVSLLAVWHKADGSVREMGREGVDVMMV